MATLQVAGPTAAAIDPVDERLAVIDANNALRLWSLTEPLIPYEISLTDTPMLW